MLTFEVCGKKAKRLVLSRYEKRREKINEESLRVCPTFKAHRWHFNNDHRLRSPSRRRSSARSGLFAHSPAQQHSKRLSAKTSMRGTSRDDAHAPNAN